MARRRRTRGRKVNGILVLNKPVGFTSNDVLQKIKRLYQAQKAGHTGSLDKPASGVFPICFGEATKLSGFLLDSNKQYLTRCQLGVTTTTGDAAGDIVEQKPVPEITEHALEKVLDRFRGGIMQVPPMHSALKHKGERLYKLAYQGIEVEREARPVTIYDLSLIEMEQTGFRISVRCSKGTYIRTLVEDIGRELGCGAHVTELQRTAAGPFKQEDMHSVEELESVAEDSLEALDRLLLPLDKAVEDMAKISLVDSLVYYLRQGQAVVVPQAPTEGNVRLYQDTGEFLGIGQIQEDGRVAPRRLLKL